MKKSKSAVYVGMSQETKKRFQSAADQRELSLSAWLVQAGFSYEKSAKQFQKRTGLVGTWPSGWRKDVVCFVCKHCGHDPLEKHPEQAVGDGEIHSVELGLMNDGYYKSCKVEVNG